MKERVDIKLENPQHREHNAFYRDMQLRQIGSGIGSNQVWSKLYMGTCKFEFEFELNSNETRIYLTQTQLDLSNSRLEATWGNSGWAGLTLVRSGLPSTQLGRFCLFSEGMKCNYFIHSIVYILCAIYLFIHIFIKEIKYLGSKLCT